MNVLERIACNNFVEKDGYAYLSNCFYNGFFIVEIQTGRTVFQGAFEKEKLSQEYAHREIFLKNNKVYFCPWKGRHLHIWDLEAQSLRSVEIRTKEERTFAVDGVILGEKEVFFLPDQENIPAKGVDFDSFKVTERRKILGKDIFELKDIFPKPELITKCGLEPYADRFFWKRVFGRWYAFGPLGCHLMCYTEGRDELEFIPLAIENKGELDKHLQKVRMELLDESPVIEHEVTIRDFLDYIKIKKASKMDEPGRGDHFGTEIWTKIKGEDSYHAGL